MTDCAIPLIYAMPTAAGKLLLPNTLVHKLCKCTMFNVTLEYNHSPHVSFTRLSVERTII